MSGKKSALFAEVSSLGCDVAEPELKWGECCLCQRGEKRELVCPAENPIISQRNKEYGTLAINLERLKDYDYKLPNGKDISCFDEGQGIAQCLETHRARWHKKCHVEFSGTRFNTLLNSLTKRVEPVENPTDDKTSTRKPPTRSSSSSLGMKDEKCFICLGPKTWKHPLRQCATKEMSEKIKDCASALGDSRIAGLLELGGDLIAMEAKYHCNCVAQLYRRHEQLTSARSSSESYDICYDIAIGDLIVFIESKLALNNQYIFKMGHLTKMLQERIIELQNGNECIKTAHTTRLREKLLAYFPTLTSEKWGKEYVLRSRSTNFMFNVSGEEQDDDILGFYRFVNKLRKSVSELKLSFQGTFSENCERESIPGPLLAAMNFIVNGSSALPVSGAGNPVLTIAQLVIFNFHKKDPKGEVVRHSNRNLETPFPLYVGLSCYSRKRDRIEIDMLHRKGVCVSYSRVREVTSQLCRMVVQRAKEETVVCPANLRKGIFTVSALDNIDFKSTSTTSVGEFHGTGISIFQCPSPGVEGQCRLFQTSFSDVYKRGDCSVPELPETYSLVPDCVLTAEKPLITSSASDITPLELLPSGQFSKQWNVERPWLSSIRDHLNGSTEDQNFNVSWSAFHAAQESSTQSFCTWIEGFLPLFYDKSATVSMIKHGMDVVRSITEHLNAGQVPVMCVDQPLFALAKKIQWNWQQEYGEEKFVMLLGPLHIEQAFLRLLGHFTEGCGWTTIVSHSDISSLGSAEAMLKVTHIKRAREIHQVTAAVLHDLLLDAYEQEHPDRELSLDEWLQQRSQESPTFYFWLTLLNLEVTLLAFVSSVRHGNFNDFKCALKQMAPWFFVFDHHNYARWLPVHIYDLEQLPQTAADINNHFTEGRFVVHKTLKNFSGIGVDHAHEQGNAGLKSDGGVKGATHDPSMLRRLAIGGPEVKRLLKEFESLKDDYTVHSHHEQSLAYQSRCLEQCIALKEAFMAYDNPFSIREPELITLDTRVPVPEDGVTALRSAEGTGLSMYTNFCSSRLIDRTQSFYDAIPKCNAHIFTAKRVKESKTSAMKMLKADINLFSRSFIVSVARDLDLRQFFAHENHAFPPSLSVNGNMRTGDKSQLVLLLEKLVAEKATEPFPGACDGLIIDGGGLVHNLAPRGDVSTFDEYAKQLIWHVSNMAQSLGATRVDIAWDLYFPNSLKTATRTSRGAGVRRIDLPKKGKLPTNWPDYLRNDDNKEELFTFLAQSFARANTNFQVVTNLHNKITASESASTALDGLLCSEMEEADERTILHLQDMVQHAGAQRVVIRSSDTDVVVLAVSFYPELQKVGLKDLWVLYGSGTRRRYISVHDICNLLGCEKSLALRGFHAYTGCDYVSFFASKGKRSAWAAWDNDETTKVFKSMSLPLQSEQDVDDLLPLLEKFTCKMYGIKSDTADMWEVNLARRDLFASENRHVAAIPPTQGALLQHARRAAYVAGQVWGRATSPSSTRLSPEGWGWAFTGERWDIIWSRLPDVWEAVQALDRCGCRTGCETQRCRCRRFDISCSPACKVCKGECANKRNKTALPDIFGDA